jgi:TM2 domain-containing membrane protein YozV
MEENKQDNRRLDMFLMTNAKYFESHQLPMIRDRLENLDEDRIFRVQTQSYKDPTMMLVVSILAGSLGIDRFLIGEVGLGVAKLLTCGGLGIWTIVDWFLIMGATREKNLERLELASAGY